MAIQEIPLSGQKDIDGDNMQRAFAAALAPEFVVHFAKASVDTALVSKKAVDIKMLDVDKKNRIQVFCDQKTKDCILSLHFPFSESSSDLKERCQDLAALYLKLKNAHYQNITAVGDFNSSAGRIEETCTGVKNFNPVIKTSELKDGQSCRNNSGDPSPNNIDLLLSF
jgi:hypothetical protein